MKVSVCIPVFNGEDYIRETIESVLKQTYKDFELVIIDNQSTDNTVEIVREISDDRVKLIENDKNYGMFGNWNKCLKMAEGEYIHILCADDCLKETCLEKQVKILDDNKDVTVVFNASNVVDETGKVIMHRRAFRGNKILDGCKFAKKSFRCRNMYGEPSNVMFRKSVSKQVGEFNPDICYSSDWDYWIRMSVKGKVAYIDEYLTDFRISTTSGTSGILNQKDRLKKDNDCFIESVKGNKELSINLIDIFMHNTSISFRTFAKKVFCVLVRKK